LQYDARHRPELSRTANAHRAPAGARPLDGRLMAARNWLLSAVGRKGLKSFRLRLLVQAAFAVGCLLLGTQFARFVRAAGAGALPLPGIQAVDRLSWRAPRASPA